MIGLVLSLTMLMFSLTIQFMVLTLRVGVLMVRLSFWLMMISIRCFVWSVSLAIVIGPPLVDGVIALSAAAVPAGKKVGQKLHGVAVGRRTARSMPRTRTSRPSDPR
jgi:hypothetical protein